MRDGRRGGGMEGGREGKSYVLVIVLAITVGEDSACLPREPVPAPLPQPQGAISDGTRIAFFQGGGRGGREERVPVPVAFCCSLNVAAAFLFLLVEHLLFLLSAQFNGLVHIGSGWLAATFLAHVLGRGISLDQGKGGRWEGGEEEERKEGSRRGGEEKAASVGIFVLVGGRRREEGRSSRGWDDEGGEQGGGDEQEEDEQEEGGGGWTTVGS